MAVNRDGHALDEPGAGRIDDRTVVHRNVIVVASVVAHVDDVGSVKTGNRAFDLILRRGGSSIARNRTGAITWLRLLRDRDAWQGKAKDRRQRGPDEVSFE